MVDAIARSIDPPDLSLRSFGSECVQHRHHGCCAYSSAEQNHRTLARAQSEASARRTNIQYIAFSRTVAQKCTANPVQFALDADAQMVRCRQIRQRIAAEDRRFVRVEMQAQNDKLPRLEDRDRLRIDWLQDEGSYVLAFLMDTRDPHLPEAGPCWRPFLIGESRIPCRSFGAQVLLEHCLERTLPTLAKCRHPQRALQLLAGMSRQIQEGVNLGHGDSLRTVSNFCNVIARPNFSLLQHAKVESWSVMCYEHGCHPRFIHADADAVARHAWLRYFKFSTTDAVAIADADLVIGKSLNSEVFSELAESEVVAAQNALPVMVRIHLVDKYGAMLPAVTGEIGLRITIDIELAHHSPSCNRRFPNCGSNSFAIPCHIARKADIH